MLVKAQLMNTFSANSLLYSNKTKVLFFSTIPLSFSLQTALSAIRKETESCFPGKTDCN